MHCTRITAGSQAAFLLVSLVLSPLLSYDSPSFPSSCLALSPLSASSTHHHGIVNHHGSSRRAPPPSSTSTSSSSTTTTHLSMISNSYSFPEPDRRPQRTHDTYDLTTDNPTQTKLQTIKSAQIPPRPKIVIFGASGRIGRRIVQKLMSSSVDADIVAYVRDREKFQRVMYDVCDDDGDNLALPYDGNGVKRVHGPQLHVVVGNLVSRVDVFRGTFETEEEKRDLDKWVEGAMGYFKSRGGMKRNPKFMTGKGDDHDEEDIAIMEAQNEELEECISGATILISCVGSYRPSNFWTDYLRVPFIRVFRKDASKWCSDPSHPYYVNYLSTKKILELAEEEQKRRSAYNEFERQRLILEDQWKKARMLKKYGYIKEEEEEDEFSGIAAELAKKRKSGFGKYNGNSTDVDGVNFVQLPNDVQLPSSTDRIKIIRISDVCVGRNPWGLGNILMNVFQSSVFRYQQMGEKLLEESKFVDTIVLRPGELTDEKRNVNKTSLQLAIDGNVPKPSLVGRDDIADIAVVAALSKSSLKSLSSSKNKEDRKIGNKLKFALEGSQMESNRTHHYTWAVRWAGQHLPNPQGRRPDGLPTAALCFVKAVKAELGRSRLKRMEEKKLKLYYGGREWIKFKKWLRRTKPYAMSVAIPVYMTLAVMSWILVGAPVVDLLSRANRFNIPHFLIKILP